MTKKENTPAIRFKGFSEEWKERKFGDVGSVAMCKRIFKEQTSDEGNVPFYKIGTFGSEPDAFISRKLFDEYKTKYPYPNKGDILISASGSIGRTVEFAGKDEYFQDSNIVWLKHGNEIDNCFLKILYSVVEWSCEGSTIKRLYNDNFLKTEFMLPERAEQQKIGTYFRGLDRLIALQKRKLEKLAGVKKSMLQKMFPPARLPDRQARQSGRQAENAPAVPQIRFKGFTEPWEQRKLGEIGTTYTGLSGKTAEDFGHGEAKFLPYLNIFNNPIADTSFLESIEIDNSQNQIQYGDVFFTTSSETPEEVGMSSVWLGKSANIYLNSFCFGFRPTIEFNPYYLGYLLRSDTFRKPITILAQGISRFNISKTKVMEIEIPLPCIAEQQKIGAYFSSLDRLIALHRRKLEKLQNLKKACLEKMFV